MPLLENGMIIWRPFIKKMSVQSSQLPEKTQEDIAIWKRIPLIFTLLLALCLPACNPQAVSAPTTIVPGSPTSSTSPVSLMVYAQPDFTTHTLYPTGQNTPNNAGY